MTCDRNTALCTKVHRAVKMMMLRCACASLKDVHFFKPRPINFTRGLRHPTIIIRTAQSVETRTVGLHLNRYRPIPVLYKPIWLTKGVTNCPIGQNSSIAAFDLYERTARCKFISRVDFSSRLEMTCNKTDGARKFRR